MSEIIVRPRQAGKTHAAVQWVLEGEAIASYPGWSRVLLTHSLESSMQIRKAYPALDYRQVFSVEEWRRARLGNRPIEVAVDDADMVLEQMLHQSIRLATWNGVVR